MLKGRYELGTIIPYFVFGPRLNYQISYKTDSEYKVEDQNRLLFGLNYGPGLEIKLSKVAISAELKHNIDLTDVVNEKSINIKNKALVFDIGLKFYLRDFHDNYVAFN